MATNSPIEWTDATWNPVTGCSKISPGCKHCYAERMANRLKLMGQANYRNGFDVTLQPQMLELPLRWKTPKRIFVNSMSDLFHLDVPLSYIENVFDVMRRAHWHQFQVLTKRAERIEELSPKLVWAPNIWMGVSVENGEYAYRIAHLRKTDANVKFLSIEPLIGPVGKLDLGGIDWVIVGGESGPRARPMRTAWVLDVKRQCEMASGSCEKFPKHLCLETFEAGYHDLCRYSRSRSSPNRYRCPLPPARLQRPRRLAISRLTATKTASARSS